jgi:UDP-glucose 4-epimerase
MPEEHPSLRTLDTGGAGFIGSHLAERLVAEGDEVLVLDDLSTGSLENLGGLLRESRFRFRAGSVTDERAVAEVMAGAERVFHLAAAVGVRLVALDPARALETNVRGTEIVARQAAAAGAPMLLASSSEVYGKGAKLPLAEDDDLVLGPTTSARWSYGCSKTAAEHSTLARAREIPVVVARLFNTVGARQSGRYGMVLPRFVEAGLRGDPITVYGSGAQRRCFADVREVVDCLVRLAEAPVASGGVFNVGSDHEIPIRSLAELVREHTGARSEIVTVDFQAVYGAGFEDVERRIPALGRLAAAIGRRPQRSIEAIVDEVVEHARGRG